MKKLLFILICFISLFAINTFSDTRIVGQDYTLIYHCLDESGDHVASQTITLSIRKAGTAYFYDFNDSTFKTSGWTSKTVNLTEDASNSYYNYTYEPPSSETDSVQLLFIINNNSTLYRDNAINEVIYQLPMVSLLTTNYDESGTFGEAIINIGRQTDGVKDPNWKGIENLIRRGQN